MSILCIRDFVPDVDKTLTDIELVNKYIHQFVGVTNDIIDLRCLTFTLGTHGSGSAGTLYKAQTKGWYFKLSQFSVYEPDICGYDSVCEVIGSIVAEQLGFANVKYQICHAVISIGNRDYTTWLCVSRNYKNINEHRTTLENALQLKGCSGHDSYENFMACSYESYFSDLCKMMLLDYIVDNRDRHGANIELLVSDSTRLAPIYDTGYSLLAPLQYDLEKIRNFNYLHEGPVNNFLISRYWEDVLIGLRGFIEVPDVNLNNISFEHLAPCFEKHGSVLLKAFKIMIVRRAEHAKEILNT